MSENSKPEKKDDIDPELAKARKSMGNRIDPDPIEEEKEKDEAKKKPEENQPEKKDEENKEGGDKTPDGDESEKKEEKPEEKKVDRPEAYIPMPKYLSEKKDWENDKSLLAEAQKKIEELTILASQKDTSKKDEDIEAFMAKTGFDRETVDGLLNLAESRIKKGESISPEEKEIVAKASEIVKEKELIEAFNNEFKSVGEPEIKKLYPNATDVQLAKAKEQLDKIAHTKDNKDKSLDFIIFKNKDDLAKIFTEGEEEKPTPNKKTIEASKMGNGKQSSLTAKDFKDGKTDFSILGEIDQTQRSQIVRDMDSSTYSKYLEFAKNRDGGVEVMRNGRKIVLK